MSKYKQFFQEMLELHKETFAAFRDLHDRYAADPKNMQAEFNEKGQDVQLLIQRYLNRLCLKMESGKYGKFSSTLSDKFWEEVRKEFPKIDYIGLKA